ncbi:hypothetical protein D3C86_1578130 [compost metagenome]
MSLIRQGQSRTASASVPEVTPHPDGVGAEGHDGLKVGAQSAPAYRGGVCTVVHVALLRIGVEDIG